MTGAELLAELMKLTPVALERPVVVIEGPANIGEVRLIQPGEQFDFSVGDNRPIIELHASPYEDA